MKLCGFCSVASVVPQTNDIIIENTQVNKSKSNWN